MSNDLGEWDDELTLPAGDEATAEANILDAAEFSESQDAEEVSGLEFYLTSADCAALITERLGKKTTPATFRRTVIEGDAPAPAGRDGKTVKWAQTTIDAWLTERLATDETTARLHATASNTPVPDVASDGREFYLSAAEAAALATETLGTKITVAMFRRMVTRQEAPAPWIQAGGTAKWSQTALDTWLEKNLRAKDESGESEEDTPKLFYSNVAEFVAGKLAASYRRHINVGGGITWCPQWWKHAEAISRLEALWRAWEFLRLDAATGMSVWWRDHADHHMSVLLSADGPFKGCSPDDGHKSKLPPLPCEEPPAGLF